MAPLLTFALAFVPQAATWHVDDDAPGDPGPGDPTVSDPAEDGSAAHPYDTIAEALAAAASGDTVEVAAGLYQGAGNRGLSFGGKALTLRGAGATSTEIHAEHVERILDVPDDGPGSSLVEGLTLSWGYSRQGGALRIAAPDLVVKDCYFLNNLAASRGAAIWIERTMPVFTGEIVGCRFEESVADEGAAFYSRVGGGRITSCTFLSNHAVSPVGNGGAIYLAAGMEIEDCLFSGNTADADGGAIYLNGPADPVRVTTSRLISNFGGVNGGGIYGDSATLSLRSSILANNGATVGSGGGINFSGTLSLVGSTVANNSAFLEGAGLQLRSGGPTSRDFLLSNSILWGNFSLSGGSQLTQEGPADLLSVEWCDLDGGAAAATILGATPVFGPGVIDVDPAFVDPGAWNYHLQPGSPCIDAGDPSFLAPPLEVDVDGDPRVQGLAIDLGADESP